MLRDGQRIAERPDRYRDDEFACGRSYGEGEARSRLQDRRGCRRQREIVGRRRQERRRSRGGFVARSSRRGSDEDGHEGRGGQDRRLSYTRVSFVQVRELISLRGNLAGLRAGGARRVVT